MSALFELLQEWADQDTARSFDYTTHKTWRELLERRVSMRVYDPRGQSWCFGFILQESPEENAYRLRIGIKFLEEKLR